MTGVTTTPRTVQPDVVGTFALRLPDDTGRLRARLDGFRPVHAVRPGELFGGEHVYPDSGRIEPGTTRPVEVSFFFPENMSGSLWPGKRVRVQEGGTLIGTLTVGHVVNTALDVRTATSGQAFEPEALAWSQWVGATGGYGLSFDSRPLIRRIAEAPLDATSVWGALWENLYHQGDIGLASLLTVPLLAALRSHTGLPDWNVHALACAIEESRLRDGIEQLPALHFSCYSNAMTALARLALADLALDDTPELVRSALGIIAFARELPSYGALLSTFTDDEVRVVLRDYRGW